MCLCVYVIKYKSNPLHLQRVGKRDQTKKERKKEGIQEVGCTGLLSMIGKVSTETSTIMTWISLVKRPLPRPKLTQKGNIMRDIMELILYCASFVTHDVEMLGGYTYDNVILLRRVVVQYCPVLVC